MSALSVYFDVRGFAASFVLLIHILVRDCPRLVSFETEWQARMVRWSGCRGSSARRSRSSRYGVWNEWCDESM